MVWIAYSRQQHRGIAYHIGDRGVASAITIYHLAKQAVGEIGAIFTDADSCDALAFKRHGVCEPHTQTKAQTHLIESSNSSIRDRLARFNRRSKRTSKTLQMLEVTLTMVFNRNLFSSPK